jgi:glycosyltransferase involved in cell wall biosynthesis
LNSALKKIVLITDKQPSSNPRLVKEAISLSDAGFSVTVIYNFWSNWAERADIAIKERYPQINWCRVGPDPLTGKNKFRLIRIRHKLYRWLANLFPGNLSLQSLAISRFYPELKSKARSERASIYVAHNLAALPIASWAASKNEVRYSFDAEDFHRGQESSYGREARAAVMLEDAFLPEAAFITAASPLIASAYSELYPELIFNVINNVSSINSQPALVDLPASPLRFFWFSQTVGLNRGIPDIIQLLNEFEEFPIELLILGDMKSEVRNHILKSFKNAKHKIIFKPPCAEEEIISIASGCHIGLAIEPGFSVNNKLALSNKLFTYLLAGNAIIFTQTPAQHQFIQAHPQIGWSYNPGDIRALKDIITKVFQDMQILTNTRRASWNLARTHYNWEMEGKIFLNLVNATLSETC